MNTFLDTWRNIILNPTCFFKNMPESGNYVIPLKFGAINFMVVSIVISAQIIVSHVLDIVHYILTLGIYFMEDIYLIFKLFSTSIMFLFFNLVVGIACLFISSIIFYAFFKVIGGKGTYGETFRQITYSSAPVAPFLIPFIQVSISLPGDFLVIFLLLLIPLLKLYSLFLIINGGKYVHNISTVRSTIAVVLPTLIIGGIYLVSISSPFIYS